MAQGAVVGLVVSALILLGCASATPTPTPTPIQTPTPTPEPPYEHLESLVQISDAAIIGRVVAKTESRYVLPEGGSSGFDYYDATVAVERRLFGANGLDMVTVRVPYYVFSTGRHIPTKAPALDVGTHALLFLSHSGEFLMTGDGEFVTAGGGLLWGAFWIQGDMIQPYAITPMRQAPLDDMVRWMESAVGG